MNLKVTITTILCFLLLSLNAQDMQEGYQFLETNQYQNAKQYFNEILKKHPGNKTARICLARAMGLSNQKEQALTNLQELAIDFQDDFEIELNLAEAHMWNNQFIAALDKYKTLIDLDPYNFTAHLGYANALAGLQKNQEALQFINKALVIEPGNPGAINSKKYILIAIAYDNAKRRNHSIAENYLDSIDHIELNQPNAILIRNLISDHKALKGNFSYYQSEDNAANKASGLTIYQNKAWSNKNIISLEAHLRSTDNDLLLAKANQDLYFIKNKIICSEKFNIELGIGMLHNKSNEVNTKNITSSAQLSSQINKYNFLSIGHHSSYLNYNSQLVENNLRIDNIKLDHHLYSKYRIGFYNSVLLGYLGDSNKNLITFSSLYYQWKENPVIKLGVNYSYIHFDQHRPELYFSPDRYQVGEAFIHLENISSSSRWKYKVLLATGIQKVENNKQQQIARIEFLAGYQFSKEITLNLNYQYSNSAQINTIGTYEFQSLGITLNTVF